MPPEPEESILERLLTSSRELLDATERENWPAWPECFQKTRQLALRLQEEGVGAVAVETLDKIHRTQLRVTEVLRAQQAKTAHDLGAAAHRKRYAAHRNAFRRGGLAVSG